ncbi:glutamine cyclotransferase [Babesia ovis]|uniref:Glutamine cyclotransferase n=1 Tax=Babesia ovis TaxID=5869 RepID=A0A9W5TD77_BABOV|nr:glutamine cyclotransferase [Babesia ovis]
MVLLSAILLAWIVFIHYVLTLEDGGRPVVARIHDVKWTQVIPHSCTSGKTTVQPFTQGLLFTNERTVLETSGLSSRSFVREFLLDTGRTLRRVDLPNDYFSEGAALVVEPSTLRLYVMVLTYTDNMILFYDYKSFKLMYMHPMRYVGFGLTSNYDPNCSDPEEFVKYQRVWMTTGGYNLISLALPPSFSSGPPSVAKVVTINLNGWGLRYVNEMEYNHNSGTIYGNIWQSHYVVEIDPQSGICLRMWDLSPIAAHQPRDVDVMNGIACHPASSTCLVTGKFWPYLYHVLFSDIATPSRDIPSSFYQLYCHDPKTTSRRREVL